MHRNFNIQISDFRPLGINVIVDLIDLLHKKAPLHFSLNDSMEKLSQDRGIKKSPQKKGP